MPDFVRKMARVLPVLCLLLTYASLGGTPVRAAAQAWSVLPTPGAQGLVIARDVQFSGPLACASNGASLYCYVHDGTHRLLRSNNDGRTWSAVHAPGAPIVALRASPSEPNVVYYATATTVYKSVDAGASFVSLASVPAGSIVTMAVRQVNGCYLLVVGTAGAPGDVYVLDEASLLAGFRLLGVNSYSMAAVAAGYGPVTGVLAVAISPGFLSDRAVVAVGTDGVSSFLLVNTGGSAWGAAVASPPALAGGATSAAVAFPASFSNILISPFYFGIGGAVSNGVYRFAAMPAPGASLVNRLTTGHITSLESTGGSVLFAGTADGWLLHSTDLGLSWPNPVSLGSSTACVSVLGKPGGNLAFALAGGSLAPGDDGALYLIRNLSSAAPSCHAVSLIGSLGEIVTLEVTSSEEMFLATRGAGHDVLWRFYSGNWERVWRAPPGSIDFLEASPSYRSDATLFIADGAAAPVPAVLRSTNAGESFTAQSVPPGGSAGLPNPVTSLLALGSSALVVGSTGGTITQTSNNGLTWVESTVGELGRVTCLKRATNGDLLAAGVGPGIRVAQAPAATPGSWGQASSPVPNTETATAAYVEPAADYRTSSIFYAAGEGVHGVYWGKVGALWKQADGSSGWCQATTNTGLLAAPMSPSLATEGPGVLYSTDQDGIVRIKGRSEAISAAERYPAPPGVSLKGLWYVTRSEGNVLYSVGSDNSIWTYTDTLNRAVGGLSVTDVTLSGGEGSSALPGEDSAMATIRWNPVDGATYYLVAADDKPITSIYQALNTPSLIYAALAATNTVKATGLPANTALYVCVWALAYYGPGLPANLPALTGHVTSSFAAAKIITTPLGQPLGLSPPPAACGESLTPTLRWNGVRGASSYQIQLADNPDFADPILDETVGDTFYIWAGPPLAPGTAYYWRVAAKSASSTSRWTTNVLRTVEAPANCPVTLTMPPPVLPEVTVPLPTVSAASQADLPPVAIVYPTPVVVVPEGATVTVNPRVELPQAETPAHIWVGVAAGTLTIVSLLVLIRRGTPGGGKNGGIGVE